MIKVSFDDVFSMESLYEALKNAAKGRRYKYEVLEYELDAYNKLKELQDEVYSGNYKIDKYHIFFISEPKKRMIMSIDFKHRIVQWALYQALSPLLNKSYIEDSHGCIARRGQLSAITKLRYWVDAPKTPQYYLKLDISKYFYRVDHETVKAIYRKKISDRRICNLIDNIIDCETTAFGLPRGKSPEEVPLEDRLYDVGMPIGNLMSQITANVYLNSLDQYCKRALRIHRYIRYMDDIIILSDSKQELHALHEKIEVFLGKELKLDLNKKTCIRPVSQGISFIGYRIWPHYITIRKSSSKHMKRYLRKKMKDYADGRCTAEEAKCTYLCYKAVLDRCTCRQLKEKVLGGFVLTHDKGTEAQIR